MCLVGKHTLVTWTEVLRFQLFQYAGIDVLYGVLQMLDELFLGTIPFASVRDRREVMVAIRTLVPAVAVYVDV